MTIWIFWLALLLLPPRLLFHGCLHRVAMLRRHGDPTAAVPVLADVNHLSQGGSIIWPSSLQEGYASRAILLHERNRSLLPHRTSLVPTTTSELV